MESHINFWIRKDVPGWNIIDSIVNLNKDLPNGSISFNKYCTVGVLNIFIDGKRDKVAFDIHDFIGIDTNFAINIINYRISEFYLNEKKQKVLKLKS